MTFRIGLFFTVTAISVLAGVFLPHRWLEPVFNHSAYYFILIAFVLWAALLIRVAAGCAGTVLKRHYPGLLVCVGIMVLLFHLAPPKFKILADETNLVGVSMAMHKDKTVSVPLQGLALDYTDYHYAGGVDQRPPGYPFFLSLCHGLLGYSPYNGFVVNFVAGVLALFVIYLLLSAAFSRFYGVIGILLAAACPVFGFWATSSGFEVVNLFWLVFVVYALYAFLKKRHPDRVELLFLSLVLLAYCRYESAVMIIGLGVLAPVFVTRNMVRAYRLPTLFCPLLLMPLIWQRRLNFFSGGIYVGDKRQAVDQLFGFANLAEHFFSNLFVLSGLDSRYGFLPVVSVLAAAGCYHMIRRNIRPSARMNDTNRAVINYGMACAVALFLLYAAFYWGDLATDIDNRLALIFLPFLVVPAVYIISRFPGQKRFAWKGIVAFLAVIQIVHFWPVAEKQQLIQGKSLTYEYNSVLAYIRANYDLDREKLLIISDRSNFYAIHKLGSVGFDYANRQKHQLRRLKQIYYHSILVLQRPNPQTGKIPEKQLLAGDYHLCRLKEIPVGPEYCVRLSEAEIF